MRTLNYSNFKTLWAKLRMCPLDIKNFARRQSLKVMLAGSYYYFGTAFSFQLSRSVVAKKILWYGQCWLVWFHHTPLALCTHLRFRPRFPRSQTSDSCCELRNSIVSNYLSCAIVSQIAIAAQVTTKILFVRPKKCSQCAIKKCCLKLFLLFTDNWKYRLHEFYHFLATLK